MVLTGGTSLLPGSDALAEEVFGLPARVGYPVNLTGLTDVVHSPAFATGIGLLHQGIDSRSSRPSSQGRGLLAGLVSKIRIWANGLL